MFPMRSLPRLSQRVGLRAAPVRSAAPRRFNSSEQGKVPFAIDNEFNRERAAVKHHAASTSDLWRKLALYAVIPALTLVSINSWNLWVEHWQHWEHMPPLEDRTEYPYQNIRVKNYPWGNGDKTVFWWDEVNYHNKDKTT
ncbi:hypothetical protein PHISP_04985 [Aspergillus sp. HF37]|nr:hypothetical protein PHISP_04985 [Aspergillus sp. HF37]